MSKRPKKKVSQPQPMEVEVQASSSSDEEEEFSDEEGTKVDGIYIPPAPVPTLSMDPTGPRLIITSIDNNFFKSYAENQTLGPFHKCFNAIVGPNGSGKSNVIDSLLFVFGYRATKIRSKKVSVLLHNSRSYPNVQACTVAVHFALIIDKEGDDYEVVPGSTFVVARTALKDNSSYYELNGRRVQFKDISVLLQKHGIDLKHNRFLILQGEVEQIAMMKCKGDKDGETGMLEYLEDIIGTTRYKKPLAQVFDRVEVLSERRTEKLNRLKMVEDEMTELREPMQQAVGFLKTENTVITSKNFLYQKAIKDAMDKSADVQASRDEVQEVQKQFIKNLKALNEQKQKHLEAEDEESKENEKLRKRKDKLTEAFDNANKKDVQLQESLVSKNKTRKKTKEQIEEEKKKLAKLEKVPEENEKTVRELEVRLEKCQGEKEHHEAEKAVILKNIQRETQSLQARKEELQTDLTVLKENVTTAKTAFDLAETELKMCVGNEEGEKNKLAQLQELFKNSESMMQERTKQVETLQKKIPAAKKELEMANRELLEVRQEEQTLINQVRVKRANLEEGRSSMQASSSRGRVLDSLMQAKREGKCPGLFGRLGDLGAIDAKYDVAISTACGPLDNIVVDTVNCAQWCIEYLKNHNIGRGVFIALEKQEHLRDRAESRIQTPENVHRLYDLIRVQDDRVRTAFYYALRDTLVANDLEQASRIAYGAQRYRVVTLQGDLIETSGTMSGGGKRVSRGRMGQSVAVANVDPRELSRLEQDVVRMEEKVRELRQRQTTLTAQITELQPMLREMQVNLEKFSSDLKNLRTQQPNLQRQINEQEARVKSTKSDAALVKNLTDVVAARKRDYDAAMETAGELQVQVDKLTKEIKEKSSGKIRKVDQQIKECTKNIEMCKAEVTRLRVAVKTAQRNYKSTKENIARMEQDVEEIEASLREMVEQKKEVAEDAKKLLACVEEVTAQLADREQIFSDVRKQVEKIVKEETKLKSEKIDIDEKLNSLNKKLNEYKAVVRSYEAKIGQLKLHEIPEETVENLKQFTDQELAETDAEAVEKELQTAENFLKAAKPNLGAIQAYMKKQVVYTERAKELEEISAKRAEMRALFEDLRRRRKEEFTTGYNIIKMKLKEMYQMITLGGDADFEMVDTYDPFSEGIQFNVRPPRKTWKKISNLSGGEKTLSSLALVFALHYYKPSPLYVMDEIDAALDFKNVSIVGNYIKERTKNAQFIIISLRSNMFELCDNLVGIYKTYNTTKTITINPTLYDPKPQVRPTGERSTLLQTAEENRENMPPNSQENEPAIARENLSNLRNSEENGDALQEYEHPSDSEMEEAVILETPPQTSSEPED